MSIPFIDKEMIGESDEEKEESREENLARIVRNYYFSQSLNEEKEPAMGHVEEELLKRGNTINK